MGKKETQINIRISKELKKKLEALAKKEYRSLSNYIQILLEKHIQKKGKDKERG